jgi:hypothetical protein
VFLIGIVKYLLKYLDFCFHFISPAWGEMCITGGVAIAQPPDKNSPTPKAPQGRDVSLSV